jgi:uncharacterized protein
MTAADAHDGPIRVLAVDGGGVRGYAAALLLAKIETATGRFARDIFDVGAGTSTGGLIVAGIAGTRIKGCDVLASIYRDTADAILPHVGLGRRLVARPKRALEFDHMLDEYIADVKLRDADVELVIPAFDLGTKTAAIFTRAAAREANCDATLRDVVLATSAAPLYLPPHPFTWRGRDGTFIDGGVFANNPALHAWQFCNRAFEGRRIRVLSLGTGAPRTASAVQPARRGVEDAFRIVDLFSAATSSSVSTLMESIAGKDYLRVNPLFDPSPTALDDSSPDAVAQISEAADAAWRAQSDQILEFLRL